MDDLYFEWDENKNQINQDKHKVSFEEAATVFYDEEGLIISDPDHSEDEDRFIIIGISKKARMLTVVHCVRESDTVIRLISARKSEKSEELAYHEKRGH